MTTRISIIWVVMTLVLLACAVPVQVMTPTTSPTTVMTTYPKPVMTTKNAVMTASVVASQSLNVRESAGWQQIRVLGVLYHGDQVELTGTCSGIWAEIVWDAPRGTAWVNSKFLSQNKCSEEK